VRRRISRQGTAIEGDARPRETVHVRHPGVVIQVGVVIGVLPEDAENARRRLAYAAEGYDRSFGYAKDEPLLRPAARSPSDVTPTAGGSEVRDVLRGIRDHLAMRKP
jgi:hypothetical protein